LDLSVVCNLLVLDLIQLECVEGTDYLSNHIISRIPVKAKHNEMQGHALEIVQVESVESKVLIVYGVGAISDDSEEIKG
jgi:hypothetical protein